LIFSPYAQSKVLAEEWAWKFVGMHHKLISWDLLVCCPAAIFGPLLITPRNRDEINDSNQMIEKILNRRAEHANFSIACVDVRDCARAHILMALKPALHGRFIVSEGIMSVNKFVEHLLLEFPDLKGLIDPPKVFDREMVPKKYDNTRSLKELGMSYWTAREQVCDTARSLAKLGFLTNPLVVEAILGKKWMGMNAN
jgi:nucleoside-diphosphate-sugar epimerase